MSDVKRYFREERSNFVKSGLVAIGIFGDIFKVRDCL